MFKNFKFSITLFFVLIICSACQNVKDAETNGTIPLDEWSSLSEKGVALNWDDLKKYSFEDIGSGIYIRKYKIEGGHQLFITGKSLNDPPDKIYIVNENGKEVYLTQDNLSEFYKLR
ncbi:hypothetical protein ACH6EH_20000 [Paenibacillus sp. JSM ZJ436]|uniref:Lipoprotein n=1 Tax=Paenibacillus algicola TaxID=2565926 RepID=A0A4P8XJ55_9BACL|nr:hypothetical protein [Paenibacillus algicola]QCT02388.1 hypothetical protein E6C60_1673 [Paenibacillus algicola]